MQRLDGVAVQLLEEVAEAAGGLIELLGGLHALVAHRVGDVVVAAPGQAAGVLIIILAALGLDIAQGLPVGVAALGTDDGAQVLGDAEDVLHDLAGVLEHMGVHPLQHIAQLVPFLAGHVDGIGLVDVARAEGLDIAALVAEAESIEGVLQLAAVHAVDDPPLGKDDLARLHLAARLDLAVGLDHAAQADVGAVAHHGVVVDDGAAVDKAALAQHRVGVHHCPLHYKAARAHHRRGADHRGGVDDGGHNKARGQQAVHPLYPQFVVSESRHRAGVFLPQGGIVHQFADHLGAFGRVVQHGDLVKLAGALHIFINHAAKAARA